MKKIITIANKKGGVGKTTIATNLSTMFALDGFKTCLIDLDPQTNATKTIGKKVDYDDGVHSFFMKDKRIDEIVFPSTYSDNLFFIPAYPILESVERAIDAQKIVMKQFSDIDILKKGISNLDFDYILIDCSPSVGTLTKNAIWASDYVITPIDTSGFALDGLSQFFDVIEELKLESGDDILEQKWIKILVNKIDKRNKKTIELVAKELKDYDHMVFDTFIRQSESLNQAVTHLKTPIAFADPKSNGTDDFMNLKIEIEKIWQ